MADSPSYRWKKMRLGILGGSFNPVHNGHLAMAEAARQAHNLDLVLFIPAGRPPHKREDLAPAEDRLEMVRLATEDREGFLASDIETSRSRISYTCETLEELHRSHPGVELFFIVGEDSIDELPGWRNPRRILELSRIVALNRPGVKAAFRKEDYPGVAPDVVERMERDRVQMTPCPIESRKIREAIRSGRSIEGLVPAKVVDYIARRGLYQR